MAHDKAQMLQYWRARREYAYELRQRGLRLRQIAERLGICIARAHSMVRRETLTNAGLAMVERDAP